MENKHPDILVRLQQLNAELAQEHALLARFTRPLEDQIQQATVGLREKHAREMGICEGRIAEMGRLINGLGRQLQERDQVIEQLGQELKKAGGGQVRREHDIERARAALDEATKDAPPQRAAAIAHLFGGMMARDNSALRNAVWLAIRELAGQETVDALSEFAD